MAENSSAQDVAEAEQLGEISDDQNSQDEDVLSYVDSEGSDIVEYEEPIALALSFQMIAESFSCVESQV